MTTQHTLRPIQLRCEVTEADYRIVTESGAPLCIAPRVAGSPCFKSEPLSELARRWNAHPALLAALEEAVNILRYGAFVRLEDPRVAEAVSSTLTTARAALRLARGS